MSSFGLIPVGLEVIRVNCGGHRGLWVHLGSFCSLVGLGVTEIVRVLFIPVGLEVVGFIRCSFWLISVGLGVVGFIQIHLVHWGAPRGRWVHSNSFRLA